VWEKEEPKADVRQATAAPEASALHALLSRSQAQPILDMPDGTIV